MSWSSDGQTGYERFKKSAGERQFGRATERLDCMPDMNVDGGASPEHWEQLSMALPPKGVIGHFKTEARCMRRLKTVRWPKELICVACGSIDIGKIKTRKNFQCRDCRHQFSVTSDTLCHRTHLDLMTWFVAAEAMIGAYKQDRVRDLLTSENLRMKLDVTYKVAYSLRSKLRKDLVRPGGGLIGHCICVNINSD